MMITMMLIDDAHGYCHGHDHTDDLGMRGSRLQRPLQEQILLEQRLGPRAGTKPVAAVVLVFVAAIKRNWW